MVKFGSRATGDGAPGFMTFEAGAAIDGFDIDAQ